MDTLVVHVLNALLYASVMFLIAGGLSLIYGVMRIVNLAHGNLYAFGAYVTAWAVGRALGGATEASFWMYALLVEDVFGCSRNDLRRHLASRGIETRSMFIPIHLQPIYRDAFRDERYPVAEELCRKGLYLPSGPSLSPEEIEYIAGAIAQVQ